MSNKSAMGQTLPEIDQGSPRVEGSLALPRVLEQMECLRRQIDDRERLGTRGPLADDCRALVQPLLARGLREHESDASMASLIGESAQKISDMRGGMRPVHGWQIVMMMLFSPRFLMGFVDLPCQAHSLVVPFPANTIQLTTSEARTLADVRSLHEGSWVYFGAALARRRFGTTLDLLNAAIDFGLRGAP